MKPRARMLVYGYGNPGRLDDGLGPALVRELGRRGLRAEVDLETAYQLQVEDAELVAAHDLVLFADAAAAGPEPFGLGRLEPSGRAEFSTHALEPGAVLALARQHFGGPAEAFLLGIRGYEFDDYGERLSPGARRNLAAAADHVCRLLCDGRLAAEAQAGPGGEAHVRP